MHRYHNPDISPDSDSNTDIIIMCVGHVDSLCNAKCRVFSAKISLASLNKPVRRQTPYRM